MNTFVYDVVVWAFSILFDLFFREVHPRSSWKIPRKGPVIFVAAPHANQFVDPLILMRVIRREAHRRISFLIAEKSIRRKFVGFMSRSVGAVPVGRALDSVRLTKGRIYLPDPENDPTLVRGVDTNFESSEFRVGGLLVLPAVDNITANAEILEIKGPEEIRVKKPFKGDVALRQLTGKMSKEDGANGAPSRSDQGEFKGIEFKVAPKVDQTEVYDAVFKRLHSGGCVGIFPEGGSHDRTELLPLKAGVAIMALGALAADPNCDLKIIPCGMNYFHAHKFRSRAVVEFGTPVEVPPELVELYKTGERREAVGKLLANIYDALVAVTVTSPDYDTLMLIQAARRLYNTKHKNFPLPMVVELNRRLVKGYTMYKDDPRIINLKKSVLDYNQQLMSLNIRDHQVEYAKLSFPKVFFTLVYRVGKLLLLSLGVLPGLFLFAPVFIAGKLISIKKSKEALAASTVKIQARDVIATWKLLVSLAFAPLLYNFYTILLAIWTYRTRIGGRVPDWVPLWMTFLFGYIFFPAITYAALRFGEVGMDVFKSLRPLLLALNPTAGNVLVKLRARRAALAHQVTDLINTLGPELFPDFDAARIVADPFRPGDPTTSSNPSRSHGRVDSRDVFNVDSPPTSPGSGGQPPASIGGGSSMAGNLPPNESFNNLAGIGLFATRPATPSKSRSRASSSGGFPVQAFSTLDSKGSFDEVSKKIRGAMKERGQRRRSE
ncbi:CTR1 suppressor protein, partial [Eremomyces bilateralis CBS 781.70]